MEAFTEKIVRPAHARWLDAIILDLGTHTYTRRELDEMGVGLHAIAAARLHRALKKYPQYRSLRQVYLLGMGGFLELTGIGEMSALVMSHCIAGAGYDVMQWIGAEGRTMKGAMANAKANKSKSRIPGRDRAARRKG